MNQKSTFAGGFLDAPREAHPHDARLKTSRDSNEIPCCEDRNIGLIEIQRRSDLIRLCRDA